ncbi:MAG: ComF family protein [Spirochaetaceae bacterium]|nr:ComF family protein [Spirochaetaceae bacterium]MCF7948445.1 ComF family protein [Spirochaetia bacterium]MCF7950151.1 ComF family protein [Spirochaetaceae bacterium]
MNWLFNFLLPVYPLRCSLCGEPLLQQPWMKMGICSCCVGDLRKESIRDADICRTCGMPLISERGSCLSCRTRQHYYSSHCSLFMYKGIARNLLKAYKFQSVSSLSFLWAQLLYEAVQHKFSQPPLIVPVPSRGSSIRGRGWDQMELIRRNLSQKYSLDTAKILSRTGGSSQKKLNYAQRMLNLSGNITCTCSPAELPRKILLIDDVYTTGATIDECSRVLKQGGNTKIYALTLALAPY